jgi:hypothetical protein
LGDVKNMKRNGLSTTALELKMKAIDLESQDKNEQQKFEIPIINPDGTADGWIFEESAS